MLKWYSTGLSDIKQEDHEFHSPTRLKTKVAVQTPCSLDATILFLGYAIAVRPITTVVIGPADATPAYLSGPHITA